MGKLKGKRVLVTGVSGFIGSHLAARLLKEGASVYAIDKENPHNSNISYFNADLCDLRALKDIVNKANPEIVVHLAACLDRNALEECIFNINYQGTVNLLTALEDVSYQRFVYLSTSESYYGNPVPFSEKMPLHPRTAYARSKAMAEEHCMRQFKEKHKPVVILRPAIVYGPGQIGNMFIPQCIASALKGEDMKMTAGKQTRDFIYIDDVVEAIIKASYIPAAVGEAVNIGSGIEVKLKDVTLKINSIMGNTIHISFAALPYRENEIWRYVLDIAKARKVLGWAPRVSLEDGLKEVIANYKQRSEKKEHTRISTQIIIGNL
ncbi:MAG: GDP-mannose 4,6-dehydratase [Nanoarchaeota archaeon]|nr:GDP-mannose 4,6-dehydratase [Nanoarchaeota archaeon]